MYFELRKWLTRVGFVLAVAILLASTACSAGNGTKETTGQPDNTQAKDDAAAEDQGDSDKQVSETPDPVTITLWDEYADNDPKKDLIDGFRAEFKKQYPYITVVHERMPEGVNDRQAFVTAMAGGSGPDAYQSAHFPIIADWVQQGFALDLTAYWDNYAEKDQFLPSALEGARFDGKLYGVPDFMYATGLLYNKALYKDAGLDPDVPPADWDQFAEFAQKLTDRSKNRYGYAMLGMDWADWWFEYYVWQAGGDLTTHNADGTVTLNFTKEPMVAALQYYKDLKWKYKVVQNNVLQDYNENQNDFYQGRAAMIVGGTTAFGGIVKNGMNLTDVGYAPMPVGPVGVAPSQVGGAYWIINPTISTEKQDAAFKWIAYIKSKEVSEKSLQWEKDNGQLPNLLSVRKDVDPSKYVSGNISADLVANVIKSAENTKLEYFLKERLSPYVVKPIQKVLVDEKADPLTELKAAEELAQREVVDPYNKEIK